MKSGLLALVAFVLAAGSATADALLLHIPAVRNGWWLTIPVALALLLAVAVVVRRRAWTTIVPAVLVLLVAALNVCSHVLPTPKAEPTVKQRDAFPDLELAAHDGTRGLLSERWTRGPLVVVMFRGPW